MRDYPELVRAAVLDSVVPLQAKMVNRRASDMEYALQKVFNDCAASPQCNTAYPELERVFNNLLVRYNQKPVTVRAYDAASGFERDIKVNGVDFLNAMGWGLHTSELVPVLPKAIYDIEQGDTTFLSFALGIPGGEYSSLALGTYFATVCSEQVYASSTEQLDADLNVSPLFKEYALSGFFGSSQRAFDLCQVLGARAYDPRDGQPVTANIPSLVFSGQYDPFTPPLTGELLAADLPDSHFYVVPGMGHAATIGNACSFSILMEFLKDPAQAPDAACLQRATFEFFLPYDGKQPIALEALNDPAQLLRGMVPAGWKRDPHALSYSRHAYLFDPTQVTYTTFAAPQYMAFTKLVDSFESVGFDGPPKRMADHLANDLLWTTYLGKYKGGPVLIALAEVSKSQTLAVVMVVTEKERSAFYDGLFLPILDAYAPK
jgi:pimeloyl-ACP methyl ester carboxylesterase